MYQLVIFEECFHGILNISPQFRTCCHLQVRGGLLQLLQGRGEAAVLCVPQELPVALQRVGAQGLRQVRTGLPARHRARLHGHRRVRRQQGLWRRSVELVRV